MKQVIKYKTFEELKSCKKSKLNLNSSLKKHTDFEELIKEIRYIKTHTNNQVDTKK
jgi:hypothetical protein